MNKLKCVCCGNTNKKKFAELNYSNTCSMNYPDVFDKTKILYCKNCTFSFNNTKINNKVLNLYYTKYYNGKASESLYNVNRQFISKLFHDDRSLSQLNLLSNFINLKNKKVLDIGSGICLLFLQINNKYMNSEIEKYIIEKQISNESWYKNNNIKILKNNIFEKIPKKYNSFFDLITMSHSLEHFQSFDLDILFKNIRSLLKKNGKLFIEVPNADLLKYHDANENMEPHLCFFTKKSINMLAKNNNFKKLFLNTFGDSQKKKHNQPTYKIIEGNKNIKSSFYKNYDRIKIHIDSEKHFKKTLIKQKRINNFLNTLSVLVSKKFIIFIFDLIKYLKSKNLINFNKREFILNEDDGEYIRIILEKNEK